MAVPPLGVVDLGRIFWLRTDKANKLGFCPVNLRLTLPGHHLAEVPTGVRCRRADWAGAVKDGPLKKSHPEYASDSHTLETLKHHVKVATKRLEALGKPVTPATVAALLKTPSLLTEDQSPCLLTYMEQVLETSYKPGHPGTYEMKRGIVRKFRAWHGAGRLEASSFTPEQALKFYAWLRTRPGSRGGEIATANNNIKQLASLFALGAKRGYWPGVVNQFKALDLLSIPRKKKARLTAEELKRLFCLPLEPGGAHCTARAAWALQFFLRGERIGACLLLRRAHLVEGGTVVEYQAQKNGPQKRVPVRGQLATLLATQAQQRAWGVLVLPYLPDTYDHLAPEAQLRAVKAATHLINQTLVEVLALAGIEKVIKTHAARRTFASIARKVEGIAATQQFLGHTTEGMTQQYLDNTDTDELDAAADRIFDALSAL